MKSKKIANNKVFTAHRSSITGKFVTAAKANKSPKTTQKEAVPKSGYGDTGRSSSKKK